MLNYDELWDVIMNGKQSPQWLPACISATPLACRRCEYSLRDENVNPDHRWHFRSAGMYSSLQHTHTHAHTATYLDISLTARPACQFQQQCAKLILLYFGNLYPCLTQVHLDKDTHLILRSFSSIYLHWDWKAFCHSLGAAMSPLIHM